MTKTKALPWSKSDEEAVELRSVTPVMAANTQRLFLWDRPANGSAKAGRTETSCQANSEDQACSADKDNTIVMDRIPRSKNI